MKIRFILSAIIVFTHSVLYAQDNILISSDFPGGNIILNKQVNDTVWLLPDLAHTEGDWFYWYFKASNISNKTVTFIFEVEHIFAKYGPAYSLKNDQNWKWYGEDRIKKNSFSFSFSEWDSTAYFAMAFPYTHKNLLEFLSDVRNDEMLSLDTLCLSPEGRTIEKIMIYPKKRKPKYKVLITARHHACEMMANYVMEGIIESILKDKNCGELRQNVEFMFIPFMDKDGVENGEQGKNRIPRDHNRDYDGISIHNSTAALRSSVPAWSGGKLRVALDLHCPWINGKGNEDIYIAGISDPDIEEQQILFSKLLEKNSTGDLKLYHKNFIPYGTSWNTSDNYSKGMSYSRWAGTINGILLSGTIEFPYANVSGIPVSKDGARIFGKTMAWSINDYLLKLEKK